MNETPKPPALTLYRRPGCHLCDDAERLLADVLDARVVAGATAPGLVVIDITSDPELEARYGARIPVIATGEEEIDLVTTAGAIRSLLDRTMPVAGAPS